MESLVIAAQDKALNMCFPQRNIMKHPNDSKCRMCCMAEHIKHNVRDAQHLHHLTTLTL